MDNTILREARSTPYIGPIVPDANGRHFHHFHVVNSAVARQLINGAISEENFASRLSDEMTAGGLPPTGTSASREPVATNALATTAGGVLFNTGGSSSSSTDLSTLVQFYNESADADITAQWMELYRAQRRRSGDVAADGGDCVVRKVSRSANASKSSIMAVDDSCTPRRATTTAVKETLDDRDDLLESPSVAKTKNYSESAENLFGAISPASLSYASSTSTINGARARASEGSCSGHGAHDDEKNKLNRSMDVLPRLREFRLLEKCCSVDLPTARQIPSARLARSKEMPNIADVDD